jgi:MFS family permease
MSDRIGRRPVLLITIAVSMVGYVALAYAPGIWWAIAARGAMGFFSGNISTIQGYIVDVSPRERVAARLGWFGAAFGIGFVVGPSLAGCSRGRAGRGGVPAALAGAAALCGVACLGVLFLVRESTSAANRARSASGRSRRCGRRGPRRCCGRCWRRRS